MPLTPEAAAAQEDLFLERVRAAMESLDRIDDPITGDAIDVSRVDPVESDESEAIGRMMGSLRIREADLEERLPKNRRLVWSVRERGGLFGRRVRLVIVAAVVNPIRELLLRDVAPPRASFASVSRLVQDHLSGDGPTRLAGIFSPTGWDPGIRARAVRSPSLGLWLFEPGLADGYTSSLGRAEKPPPPFDLESRRERTERVIRYLEGHRFELLMRGIALSEVTSALDMTSEDVRDGLEEAVQRDEFLVLDETDDLYLRRA